MNDKQLLTEVLKDSVVEDKDYWLEHCSKSQSVPMTMLLEREAWKGVLKPDQVEWIDATIQSLEQRIGRDDLYALRFLPEKPTLLAALKSVKESGVDPLVVTHIVRECQKALLYRVFSLLDGGHRFEDGLDSNWGVFELDKDLNPRRPLMMFGDTAHEFDPLKDEQAE